MHVKFGKYGFEGSEDGRSKAMGAFGTYAEGSMRTAQFGYGCCLSTNMLFKHIRERRGLKVTEDAFNDVPEANFCYSLHFQNVKKYLLIVLMMWPLFCTTG